MKHVKIILIGLFFLMCVCPVHSEDEARPPLQGEGTGTREDPYIITPTQVAVKIDGKLNDEAWQGALQLDLPYETWPGENTPAPVRTECYLTYDRSNLYVGFRAFEPHPKKIRAYYFDRDKILFDDFVAIFLDTFNDERRAYGFRSNPLGVQFDDIRTRSNTSPGGGTTMAWDAIYNSAGKIYDWGYAVEMAIPFNQLRFQRKKGDQIWGINVRRIYPRNWLHTLDHIKLDRNNDCLMCQYVKIKGFEGLTPGHNVELVPTLTATRTDERSDMPAGEFEKRNQDIEPGLTVRWGIGQNLTLNGTVNPDFSQVEADSLQLDINEPFALSYDERRPFFYEGADYFNTFFNALYTRTMRSPDWGFKLTGKAGANTIGAYVVRDEVTNLIFPGAYGSITTSLGMNNFSSAFRYKLDLGRNYTIGLLLTDREGDDYFNRMGGFDGEFRFSKKDRFRFQFLGSSTRYPGEVAAQFGQEAGDFDGTALDLRYTHDTRNWDFSVGYQDLSEGFRADLGFMPQVNYRQGDVTTGYTWYGGRKSWFRQLALSGAFNYSSNQDGDLVASGANLQFRYDGPWQSMVIVAAGKTREMYNTVEFDQFNGYAYLLMRPTGKLEFSILGHFGDRIDYANTRLGQRVRLNPSLVIKPGKHMRMEFFHIYERLWVDSGRVYTANISQLTGIYHFSVRAFFRAILQYRDYDYNAGNYTFPIAPQVRRFFIQLLFSYKINPRTVLFLGYSDNYLGSQDFDLTQENRTFFVKVSYAWTL